MRTAESMLLGSLKLDNLFYRKLGITLLHRLESWKQRICPSRSAFVRCAHFLLSISCLPHSTCDMFLIKCIIHIIPHYVIFIHCIFLVHSVFSDRYILNCFNFLKQTLFTSQFLFMCTLGKISYQMSP